MSLNFYTKFHPVLFPKKLQNYFKKRHEVRGANEKKISEKFVLTNEDIISNMNPKPLDNSSMILNVNLKHLQFRCSYFYKSWQT
jgi:hypothetical protein